ncbi:hypothetical protein FBZ83_12910 [Azospirillum brasilense]|uniref:Uncharacterized protein n=1 Tax=Azospirillum brasilense TaxID=192 RepID=A0A560BM78_AZOBR|nr:hypothetical protein [Azospirillum brasilense]TWA73718.1 hypothetical protein FBZ83_12910 [Azospirillum brasilense]
MSRFYVIHVSFAAMKAKKLKAAVEGRTLTACKHAYAVMTGYMSWSELTAVQASKRYTPSPLDEDASADERAKREAYQAVRLAAFWDIPPVDALTLVCKVRPTASASASNHPHASMDLLPTAEETGARFQNNFRRAIAAEPPSSITENHTELWGITMSSIELKRLLEDAGADASEELIECADHLYQEHQAQEKYDTRSNFLAHLKKESERAGDLLGDARDDMDDLYDAVSTHNPPAQQQISFSSPQLEYLKSLARVDHAEDTFRAVEFSDVEDGFEDEDSSEDDEGADDDESQEDDDSDSGDCPRCHGSGFDPQDGGQCEDCYGTGLAGEAS